MTTPERGKRIHCKGCGRWLFEVDAYGRVLRPRPRAGELENYHPPDPATFGGPPRIVVRCTHCGTAREWSG